MRNYARVVGSVPVLVGLVRLTSLAGLFLLPKLNLVESFFHISVGLMFVYVGFLHRDAEVLRIGGGGLGMLLIVSKTVVIGIGLLLVDQHDFFNPIEVICVVVGIGSILAATLLKPD
ncbi:MAG: hypothetical protein M3P37_06655 [Actinomycetota bacterium]|nr:hypothetical protein [Actinomycetota bacterium]